MSQKERELLMDTDNNSAVIVEVEADGWRWTRA